MTVVDQLNVTSHTPNVDVCWAIDAARWKALLYPEFVLRLIGQRSRRGDEAPFRVGVGELIWSRQPPEEEVL